MNKRLSLLLLAFLIAPPLFATGISSPNTYNPAAVTITGGTITGTTLDNGAIGATTPSTVKATTVNATTGILNNGNLLVSPTAPVIASGFGTSPFIVSSNGSAAFSINVGTGGGSGGQGAITMPAAPHGWACALANGGQVNAGTWVSMNSTSATNIAAQAYTISTGVATGWTSGAVLQFSCSPF